MALETTNIENIICDKHNMILKRDKINNIFTIEFFISNSNIEIKNIVDVGLYKVLAEINKDIIEKIDLIDDDKDSINTKLLFVFKRFGSEFGIAQKYMFLETKRIDNGTQIILESKSIPYDSQIKGCEIASSKFANLYVYLVDNHSATIKYIFNIDFHEDLPIYMENMVGVLMKKIFLRVKSFIENIR
tara:strand:- start:10005 stop:10568 length:564 start_codon:yes stop_codon:yes gene_type:complete